MRRLSDLWVAMTTRRANRIDATEAERLLAGQSTGADRAGVAALLSEASAAARPDELTGEADAVEDYLRVRSAAPSGVDISGTAGSIVELSGRSPWYARSTARTVAIRVAVGLVLLFAIGTVSVHFGYLPIRMQQVPSASSSPTSAPSPSPSSPEGRRAPGSQPSAGALPSPTVSTGAAVGSNAMAAGRSADRTARAGDTATAVALCRTWMDYRQDEVVRDDAARRLRSLMTSLDGPNGIPAFCRKLLASPVAASTPPTASPTAPPTASLTAPPTATPTASPAKAPKTPKTPRKSAKSSPKVQVAVTTTKTRKLGKHA
jgi:hypothetical protein